MKAFCLSAPWKAMGHLQLTGATCKNSARAPDLTTSAQPTQSNPEIKPPHMLPVFPLVAKSIVFIKFD